MTGLLDFRLPDFLSVMTGLPDFCLPDFPNFSFPLPLVNNR